MSSFLKSRWLFGILIPCIYIIFELGFNHQLLSVTADTVNEETLKGLEFWGRLLSGLGLGLLLFQWTKKFKRFTFSRLIFSLLLGVALMWNVQQWMTDYWVDAATPEIKKSAFVLATLSPAAGAGELTTLNGDKLLNTRVSRGEQKIVSALFPAASLYADSQMLQLANWQGLEIGIFEAQFKLPQPVGVVNNAFKNLIVPPLALGLSTFFALFNFAQLTSNLLLSATVAARQMLTVGVLVVLVALSLSYESSFLDSPGYKNSLRPGLWSGDITLAVLTEWSFRSVACWQPLSEWIHHHALRDFAFGRPRGGSI